MKEVQIDLGLFVEMITLTAGSNLFVSAGVV